jgi:hypothetical protein
MFVGTKKNNIIFQTSKNLRVFKSENILSITQLYFCIFNAQSPTTRTADPHKQLNINLRPGVLPI